MRDLTREPIVKLLLSMSGMFMVNIVMGALFSMVNIYWVGRLGAHALAAVTLTSNPMMMVLAVAPVISVGARVLIAQAVGARDQDRATLIFNAAFGASLIVALPAGGILWANRQAFGSVLTNEPGTAALIAVYCRWLVPAIVLQIPMAVLGSAIGGTGNVRVGMLTQTGSVFLCLILTPLLIFGWLGSPQLGLAGAGLAAFLSSSLCVIGLLAYLARSNSYLRLRPRLWFSRPGTLWKVLKIGLPTGLEGGVMGCYAMVVTLLLRPFGPVEQAAFGVGQALFMAGIVPLLALSRAASVLAAQNFGATLGRRVSESFKAALALGLTLSPILIAIFQIVPHWLCGLFSDNAAVVEGGVRFLRITSISLIPNSVVFASFAVLTGLGNTRASLVTSTTHAILVVFFACFLTWQPGFNPDWIWEIMVAATIVEMLMALFFVRLEFSRHLRPLQQNAATEWVNAR